MTVCKCDRCGKYVDKDVVPHIKGCFDPLRHTSKRNDIQMDLCPECYALLREFLGYHDDYKHEEKTTIDELRTRKIDELKDMVSEVTGVPKSILEKEEE